MGLGDLVVELAARHAIPPLEQPERGLLPAEHDRELEQRVALGPQPRRAGLQIAFAALADEQLQRLELALRECILGGVTHA